MAIGTLSRQLMQRFRLSRVTVWRPGRLLEAIHNALDSEADMGVQLQATGCRRGRAGGSTPAALIFGWGAVRHHKHARGVPGRVRPGAHARD